jgi:hypothetical protein
MAIMRSCISLEVSVPVLSLNTYSTCKRIVQAGADASCKSLAWSHRFVPFQMGKKGTQMLADPPKACLGTGLRKGCVLKNSPCCHAG